MTEKLKGFLKGIEPWKGVVGLIFTIVLGVYGAEAWVRTLAQSAVLEEKFLATLAARVRPVCIFDSRGAIDADLGAGEYVQDIQVTAAPQLYGFEILVKCKRHLAYPPLVSAVNVDLFAQSVTRGQRNDWRVLMTPESTAHPIISVNGVNALLMDTNIVYRFKLEILH